MLTQAEGKNKFDLVVYPPNKNNQALNVVKTSSTNRLSCENGNDPWMTSPPDSWTPPESANRFLSRTHAHNFLSLYSLNDTQTLQQRYKNVENISSGGRATNLTTKIWRKRAQG